MPNVFKKPVQEFNLCCVHSKVCIFEFIFPFLNKQIQGKWMKLISYLECLVQDLCHSPFDLLSRDSWEAVSSSVAPRRPTLLPSAWPALTVADILGVS